MNDSAKDIRDVCLRLLTARDHSKKELLQKLAVKGYGRDTALAVIDELAEAGWQNDLRYAESYARSRILKGYGPVRVAYELRQNGVAEYVDLDGIAEAAAGGWTVLLEQVYRKKYRHDKRLETAEWAKRSRFLIQRGFTGDMIAGLCEHLNIKLI